MTTQVVNIVTYPRTRETQIDVWIEALGSGKYQQGKHVLTQVLKDGQQQDCCLGVLCKVMNLSHTLLKDEVIAREDNRTITADVYNYFIAEDVPGSYTLIEDTNESPLEWLSGSMQEELSRLNDEGMSFDGIALLLEYFRDNFTIPPNPEEWVEQQRAKV